MRIGTALALCGHLAIALSAGGVTTSRGVFHSAGMNRGIPYAVVLPDSYETDTGTVFPLLYALHGMGAPYDSWAVMQPLNRAIDAKYPTVIVTFEGEVSWYIDHPGKPEIGYTTFFFEELVPFIESTYRTGGQPGMRAVTGFSMGSFGAWHLMLERPDFFSSVSSLSGAFNRSPDGVTILNLYPRVTAAAESDVTLPPMYLNCGSEDRLLRDNRDMRHHLEKHGYPATLIETGGGGHNWDFWKNAADELLAWHH